jgi:opacity protein-like surface antigen
MAHPRLVLACLTVLLALTASSVSAAACPPEQRFSGTLTPGATVTLPVTTQVRGDTYFIFMPKYCSGMDGLQTVTLSIGGSSMTGGCGLGLAFGNANAATYSVQLRGDYLGMDGLGALPFQLIVYQSHCSA